MFEALDVRKHGQFLPLQSSQSTERETMNMSCGSYDDTGTRGAEAWGRGGGASGLVLWFGKEDRRQGCHRAGTLALKPHLLKQPALWKQKEHLGPGNGWGQPVKIMDPTMREKEEPA